MGAASSGEGGGPMCCSSVPCCSKTGGAKGTEIVRAPADLAPFAGGKEDGAGGGDAPQAALPAAPRAASRCPDDAAEAPQETYEDGSTFQGQLCDGRRHGYGTWISTMEKYVGEWAVDQRHGDGTQSWKDGRLYIGQFREGRFDGKGKMEWHTPEGLMVYEGEYRDDLKHGEGSYRWPDGRTYKGQWLQGKRSGKAAYTNLAGEVKYGLWHDDRIERWLPANEVSA
eukprot:TRINITY_DN46942_c0_g1_i1.p1 TRINITY_DN46942_c0_g1~~TRINITY_DN46942_c0_g1_i1.p1  ORF type:complete len:226 (-),score=30.61 TRINITY_DN46942_c0_g1_i1:124-801(-)